MHSHLGDKFRKFLDDQLRAIEDTKVKIKKRKGLISFMRIFPVFSASIEDMLVDAGDLDIRDTVNTAYARINRSMFDSLKVIARENPVANTTATMGDPEDKEALNYQILLIENMYHYKDTVETHGNPVLEEWKGKADAEMAEHMALYTSAVVRRPLGKLLDFLESTETLITSLPPATPRSSIAARASHSRSVAKAALSHYEPEKLRKGIKELKKRVQKHFGEEGDANHNRALVQAMWGKCERFYEDVEDRVMRVGREVYEGDVAPEWTRADVVGAFRR